MKMKIPPLSDADSSEIAGTMEQAGISTELGSPDRNTDESEQTSDQQLTGAHAFAQEGTPNK